MEGLIPINKRTKQFAIRIVKLCQHLVDERHASIIAILASSVKTAKGEK
jgi:hypothetical protein